MVLFVSLYASLYKKYFGGITAKIIKGMGVVRQIEGVKTDKRDRPVSEVRIESMSVHQE